MNTLERKSNIGLLGLRTNHPLRGGGQGEGRRFLNNCSLIRACLQNGRGAAARDFGRERGGATGGASRTGQSPQRAVTVATTKLPAKRPAVQRIFEEKAVWLRCSSVEDPAKVFSFVAPRRPPFSSKTASPSILKTRPSPEPDLGASRSPPIVLGSSLQI